jgi:hypothetical protein
VSIKEQPPAPELWPTVPEPPKPVIIPDIQPNDDDR